jgi:hypothetical protein
MQQDKQIVDIQLTAPRVFLDPSCLQLAPPALVKAAPFYKKIFCPAGPYIILAG